MLLVLAPGSTELPDPLVEAQLLVRDTHCGPGCQTRHGCGSEVCWQGVSVARRGVKALYPSRRGTGRAGTALGMAAVAVRELGPPVGLVRTVCTVVYGGCPHRFGLRLLCLAAAVLSKGSASTDAILFHLNNGVCLLRVGARLIE